eukprot:SM000281S10749  [mRNA]  locus=s281:72139:73320:- [translate_table: standard]
MSSSAASMDLSDDWFHCWKEGLNSESGYGSELGYGGDGELGDGDDGNVDDPGDYVDEERKGATASTSRAKVAREPHHTSRRGMARVPLRMAPVGEAEAMEAALAASRRGMEDLAQVMGAADSGRVRRLHSHAQRMRRRRRHLAMAEAYLSGGSAPRIKRHSLKEEWVDGMPVGGVRGARLSGPLGWGGGCSGYEEDREGDGGGVEEDESGGEITTDVVAAAQSQDAGSSKMEVESKREEALSVARGTGSSELAPHGPLHDGILVSVQGWPPVAAGSVQHRSM